MTVAFTGTGGVFTRIGRCGGLLRNLNGFLNATAPDPSSAWGSGGPAIAALGTNINNIAAQFASTNQQLIDGLYTQRDAYRSAASSIRAYLKTLAGNTLVKQLDDDVHLVSKTIAEAMRQLIIQMVAEAEYVPAPTVSAGTPDAGSGNNGDGHCLASVVGPDGVNLHYVFNETLDLLCTVSSQEGGTLGREQFSVKGDAAVSDTLSHEWPGGSGASASVNAVDASEDAGTGNKLTNSDFESFTSNVPDNWEVAVGSAGTHILEEASTVYGGSKALEFVGQSSSNLTSIFQEFDDSTDGTAATLKPLTVYAFSCWLRKSTGATGVLGISLWDGSDIIDDAAGNDNALSKDVSTLSDSAWTAFGGFFRTPAALPDTIRLRIHLTTTLNDTKSLFIDHAAMAECSAVYAGGPYVRVFSGADKFIKNDSFTAAINNNYGSAWQLTLERFFGMRALGLQAPTDASPTIADSLIA